MLRDRHLYFIKFLQIKQICTLIFAYSGKIGQVNKLAGKYLRNINFY